MSDDYWRQFTATVAFMEPCTLEGRIEWLDRYKTTSGHVPQMLLRFPDGRGVIVNVTQARLLEALTRERPRAGDTVRIVYNGEAKSAPPGRSPVKEFDVTITQRGSPPPAKTGKPGVGVTGTPGAGT
jgi:hypothetical protein